MGIASSSSFSKEPNQGEFSTAEELLAEFMRGGACAELFRDVQDCLEEPGQHKCIGLAWKLNKCVYTHHDYYQTYLDPEKYFDQEAFKNLEAKVAARKRNQSETLDLRKMGIASSSSSSSSTESPPEKRGDLLDDEWPEPMKAAPRKLERDLYALFPPELGESSTEEEREKASEARQLEFMRGGACGELYTAVQDCMDEPGPRTRKCKELSFKLQTCMYTHRDYYQPYLAVQEPFEEEACKHLEAKVAARKRNQS